MPPRSDLILFLDTETTGVDPEKDNLIEIGMSMLSTEEGYPEIGYLSQPIIPSDAAFLRMMEKKVVREMHETNGLLQEIIDLRERKANVSSAVEDSEMYLYSLAGVEKSINSWLKLFVGEDTTHIPYGGSGVGHFDRPFIKKYLPLFDRRISHWAYDVGVLRRTFMKAGVKYASIDAKTHRALDDARVHAEEWRYYQNVIGGLERV